jgi:hypothetical protein
LKSAENGLDAGRTSRLHAALPCLALGVPVIFVATTPDDARLDVLDGLVPSHTRYDVKYADCHCPPRQVGDFKKLIIDNALTRIMDSDNMAAAGKCVSRLQDFTDGLNPIQVSRRCGNHSILSRLRSLLD